MVLYSAVSSLLDRSKCFTLSSLGRPVHSDTNATSLGSILAMQQLRNDYSLTCPPLSIVRYKFIQLSRQRRREENGNAKLPSSYRKRTVTFERRLYIFDGQIEHFLGCFRGYMDDIRGFWRTLESTFYNLVGSPGFSGVWIPATVHRTILQA